MIKIIKKIALFMVFATSLTMFVACNDKNEEIETVSFYSSQSKKVLPENFVNNKNPFNTFGQTHNEMLDKIGFNIKGRLDEYVIKKEVYNSELQHLTDDIISISADILNNDYKVSISKDDFEKEVYEMVNNMSIEACPLNDIVRDIVLKYDDFNSILTQICSWENNLISKGEDIDSSDRFTLYYLSMFKYSFSYWYNALNDKDNAWNNFLAASYLNNSLHYFQNKGLFRDILNGIKDFTASACRWVGDHLGNIATGALGLALGDIAGGAACYYGAGFNMLNAFANPTYTIMYVGVCCASTAFASAIGACVGWTNPLF